MELQFFDPGGGERDREFPKRSRVYARIDRIEEVNEETSTILLDCIDADYLDEQSEDWPAFADRVTNQTLEEHPLPDRELSIVAVDRKALPLTINSEPDDDGWVELELGEFNEEGQAEQSFELLCRAGDVGETPRSRVDR